MTFAADGRYRGRGHPNDVGSSSMAAVSKPALDLGSSNVGSQPSRSGPASKQPSESSTRMRNGPVGSGGGGKTVSSKVQNGQ